MAFANGPVIVRDGLVLSLDAADRNSYPGSGTTWNDVSGNGYNGTLTNGPTFSSVNGGYFSFDGTNDYTSTTFTVPAQNTGTSFSWNCWVYPTRNNSADIFIGNRNTVLNFIKLTSNNFEYYPLSTNALIFGGAMTINVWQNICIVKNLTNFIYYKNGSQLATGSSSESVNSNAFYIGGDNTAGEYAQGRVATATVYNRALSATEILQNYNAQKSRFNLK